MNALLTYLTIRAAAIRRLLLSDRGQGTVKVVDTPSIGQSRIIGMLLPFGLCTAAGNGHQNGKKRHHDCRKHG